MNQKCYIASFKSGRFKIIQDYMEGKVARVGEWCGMHNLLHVIQSSTIGVYLALHKGDNYQTRCKAQYNFIFSCLLIDKFNDFFNLKKGKYF